MGHPRKPTEPKLDLRSTPHAHRFVKGHGHFEDLSHTQTAAFFNYDLSWSHSRTHGVRPSKELGALTEVGVTGALTVGVSNQCVFNTYPGNLSFNYTAFSATTQTSTTSFMLRCSSGLPWTISVSPNPAVLQGLRYTITPSPASGSGNGNTGQAVTLTGSMQAGQAGTCTGLTCAGTQAHTVFITY